MIVYQLACPTGHSFEGWYASPEAFETQVLAGHIDCPTCGGSPVRKLPTAAHVKTGTAVAPAATASESTERREALEALKVFLVANTENVGTQFAEIARRIHYGEEKHRGIRGVVTREEAAQLREEGVDALAVSPDLNIDDVH